MVLSENSIGVLKKIVPPLGKMRCSEESLKLEEK